MFTSDDQLVFLRRDRPLGAIDNFRPKPFRDDRPRQPVHRNTEVMQFTQENIRADRSGLETGEKLLRLSFNDYQFVNQAEGLLSGATLPAFLGAARFIFDDGIERILPRPG